MRPIPGDPLTGQLPRTRLNIEVKVLGPAQRRAVRPVRSMDLWPSVPDPEAITYDRIRPGLVASVRTRFGVRTWLVRTVNRSVSGRRYFTGMTRRGWCRSAMISKVISVETIDQHLAMSSVIQLVEQPVKPSPRRRGRLRLDQLPDRGSPSDPPRGAVR